MPNYLNGDISNGGWYVEGASGEIEDDKSNFDNLSTKASIQNNEKGLQRVESFSFGLNGGGSRPEALHTEYATGAAEGPAYGSQDIVFYLQRAGGSDDDSDGNDQADKANPGVSLDGSTGPGGDNGEVTSGANQLATGGVGKSFGAPDGGTMAPISGMSIDDEVEIGTFSQNANRYVDVNAAAANAVRHVESLSADYVRISLASSERLFSKVLLKGNNPDIDLSGTRDSESILGALERPSFSELAFQLSQATGGRSRAKDIVKGVNKGEIGLVNAKSRAFQKRMGAVRGSNK